MEEKLGIAGSGAIATGLAVTAAANGPVVLWARSDASVERATATIAKLAGKMDDAARADRVTVTTDLAALADCTYVVEAIVEELAPKQALLARSTPCWQQTQCLHRRLRRSQLLLWPRPAAAMTVLQRFTYSTPCRR